MNDKCHHQMVLNRKVFICIAAPSFPHTHHMREREDDARIRRQAAEANDA